MFILTTDILVWKEVGRCVQFARSEVTLAKFLFKFSETIPGKDGIYTQVCERMYHWNKTRKGCRPNTKIEREQI